MTTELPKPKIGAAIDDLIAILEKFDERQRQTILAAVTSQLQIEAPVRPISGPIESTPQPIDLSSVHSSSTTSARSRDSGIDIRTLKEEKDPASPQQMACVIAYYLQELAPDDERKDAVTSADVEKYFKQAKFKLPSRMSQLMVDARAAGYFTSPERGVYKLTRVGYNLVNHSMPGKKKL